MIARKPRSAPRAEIPTSQWWGPELFKCLVNGKQEPCPKVIDVTGAARCLLFGPYRPLSPGVWRASIFLDRCEDAARRAMAVEFGGKGGFTVKDLPYGVAGPLTIVIDQPVADFIRGEVRLWLRRAAFHGALTFGGVRVERLGDLPAPAGGDARTGEAA